MPSTRLSLSRYVRRALRVDDQAHSPTDPQSGVLPFLMLKMYEQTVQLYRREYADMGAGTQGAVADLSYAEWLDRRVPSPPEALRLSMVLACLRNSAGAIDRAVVDLELMGHSEAIIAAVLRLSMTSLTCRRHRLAQALTSVWSEVARDVVPG